MIDDPIPEEIARQKIVKKETARRKNLEKILAFKIMLNGGFYECENSTIVWSDDEKTSIIFKREGYSRSEYFWVSLTEENGCFEFNNRQEQIQKFIQELGITQLGVEL